MTDLTKNNPLADEADDLKMPTEIELLKERATAMGISFSNNIGVDSLKAKIKEKTDSINDTPAASATTTEAAAVQPNPLAHPVANTVPAGPMSLRAYLLSEATKLVRLRITNMDPKKADLPGEILTVANEYIGTIRKFVPYGEQTDNGFHVPHCLYDMLRNRVFLQIKTIKRPNGRTETKTQWVREFALEVLPELTEAELAQLATTQAARGQED